MKPDVIILCETWCNPSISSDSLQILGYYIDNSLRKDRFDTSDGRGGGIIVYVKCGLIVLESDLSSNFNQYCSFNILKNNEEFTEIIAAYRSPNSSAENTDKLCSIAENMNKNSIIIGDINLPGIKWKDGISDSKGRKLYNTAYENNIEQLIEVATHEKGGILDLVLTKNPNQILSIDVLDNLAKAITT